MKKITLLLLLATSVGVAQAKVYKCPGKVPGQYVYQESICKGAKPEEHTVKIVPFDKRKIAEAQENLAKETEALKNKDAKTTPSEATQPSTTSSPQATSAPTPATKSTGTNAVPPVPPAPASSTTAPTPTPTVPALPPPAEPTKNNVDTSSTPNH